MKLSKIAEYIEPSLILNSQEVEVSGISYNSKTTQKGDIFVCMVGEHTDGHDYVQMAAEKGAAAIIAQRDVEIDIPTLIVEDTSLALGKLSNIFNGFSSKELFLIGVTGTNGKTTVTHLIENIFEKAGKPCGLIGTLGQRVSTQAGYTDAKHTTPQAPELQGTLRKMIDNRLNSVVMEVSSHSLEQHRIEGCEFNGAVFTNLTQDHLDYHITMTNYAKAKAKLFSMLKNSKENHFAVINLDDDYAMEMLTATPSDAEVLAYSIYNEKADVRAMNIDYSTFGAKFDCITPQGTKKINLQMTGEFSVYNALAALCAGILSGIDIDTCIEALEHTKNVSGRFEVVSKEPLVIVDYAHTPDGLDNVLQAARQLVTGTGELICVFGCGGDRDATKRPKMAKIADDLADKVIITSDNPRSEDPQQIITDVLAGIRSLDSHRIIVEIDRREAIERAIKIAKPQDVLVVAGKGHEDYQILKDETIHFDDREEVSRALSLFKV
jgi:UDP-N-acetylmuramoyl-L-alanyl-D-glutamate--2,6-diaminopimelate ligase